MLSNAQLFGLIERAEVYSRGIDRSGDVHQFEPKCTGGQAQLPEVADEGYAAIDAMVIALSNQAAIQQRRGCRPAQQLHVSVPSGTLTLDSFRNMTDDELRAHFHELDRKLRETQPVE